MSKIDELLKDEKVEWKKLGDVCDIKTGQAINKNKIENNKGIYPVINSGKDPLGYINMWNTDNDPIGVTTRGAGVGSITYQPGKYYRGNLNYSVTIINKEELDERFLYHILLNSQNEIHSLCTFQGIPALNASMLKKLSIPIPSIETQEKIVKILDKFTECVTELQAELQARVKQYEYYRDKLLSEEYLKTVSEKLNLFKNKKYFLRQTNLGEIGEFTNGSGMPKTMFDDDGEIGAIHYGHIYTKYNIFVEEPIVKIKKKDSEKLKKVNYGDLVIARTSENIEDVMKTVAYVGEKEVVTGGHTAIFSHKENPMYLSYLFNGSMNFIKQKNRFARGVKVIEISTEEMKKIKVTLPPIEIQNIVVEILDKFQSLVSETQGLLPQEIEQRQKQYEFYREKLLTFDENMIQVKSSQVKSSQVLIASSYFTVLKEAYDILKINIASNYFYKLSDCTLNIEKINWNNLRELDYIDLSSINRENNSIIETTKINKNNAPSRAKQIVKESDILFGTTRPTLKRFYKVEKCYDGQACSTGFCVLRADTTKVIPKWIYYSIRTSNFFEYIKNNEVGTSYPSISDTKVKDYEILVPPLYVQEYVVSILDKFDSLINDINEGLPKEIELRQKQYEYYREKLLDFPR